MNPGQDGKIDSNFQIIEELYKKTTAYMTDDPDKKEFDVSAGVRQGGCESPSLYNLYMDFVMRVFKVEKEKAGIKGVAIKFRIPNHGANRNGFARIDREKEDFWFKFTNKKIHQFCCTTTLLDFNHAPVAQLVVHWTETWEVMSSRLRPDQHSGSLND